MSLFMLGIRQLMSTYIGQLWYLSSHMKGDWLNRHHRTSQQLNRTNSRSPYHSWLKCCRILIKMGIHVMAPQITMSCMTNSMRPVPKTHRKCWGGINLVPELQGSLNSQVAKCGQAVFGKNNLKRFWFLKPQDTQHLICLTASSVAGTPQQLHELPTDPNTGR